MEETKPEIRWENKQWARSSSKNMENSDLLILLSLPQTLSISSDAFPQKSSTTFQAVHSGRPNPRTHSMWKGKDSDLTCGSRKARCHLPDRGLAGHSEREALSLLRQEASRTL